MATTEKVEREAMPLAGRSAVLTGRLPSGPFTVRRFVDGEEVGREEFRTLPAGLQARDQWINGREVRP